MLRTCPVCSVHIKFSECVCLNCKDVLKEQRIFDYFLYPSKSPRFKIHTLSLYCGAQESVIRAYKFDCKKHLSSYFLNEIMTYFENQDISKILFVPLPSSNDGYELRGFDQLCLIFEKSSLKYSYLLDLNPHHKQSQQKYLSRLARKENALNKFIIDEKNARQDMFGFETIIVVDDLWTTGYSLMSAINILKNFIDKNELGIEIQGLVFARAKSILEI